MIFSIPQDLPQPMHDSGDPSLSDPDVSEFDPSLGDNLSKMYNTPESKNSEMMMAGGQGGGESEYI